MGAAVALGLSPPAPLRLLAGECELDRFCCGEPSLDDWLKKRARSSEGRSARTYVVCQGRRVVGYYCLATGGIDRLHLPKRLRHDRPDPVPVFVLGRMGVDLTMQGRGLGSDLVNDCFARCLGAAEIAGAAALVVHPLTEALVAFYERLGFAPLTGDRRAMFVLTETIADAFRDD